MMNMLGDKKKTISMILDTTQGADEKDEKMEGEKESSPKSSGSSKFGQAVIDAVKSGNASKVEKAVEAIFYKIQSSDTDVEVEEREG